MNRQWQLSALSQLVNVIVNYLITNYSLNVIELQITNYFVKIFSYKLQLNVINYVIELRVINFYRTLLSTPLL